MTLILILERTPSYSFALFVGHGFYLYIGDGLFLSLPLLSRNVCYDVSFWCGKYVESSPFRTNQTTLESLAPFLLLRHIPQLPQHDHSGSGGRLSDPPMEHELSSSQRRLIRATHSRLKLYDVGWRENWKQVIGWKHPWGWVPRLLYGGGG